jgi:hypothetical protein
MREIKEQIKIIKKAIRILRIFKENRNSESHSLFARFKVMLIAGNDILPIAGLCFLFMKLYGVSLMSINRHLHLFKRENAIKHANANRSDKVDYWWSPLPTKDEKAYDGRIKFCKWMIDELTKGINKNKIIK